MSFVEFLDHWQTLESGALAVGAAGLGAILLNRQIGQAERIERTRTRRRFNAVRATLPLTLSGMISYATAVTVTLMELHPHLNELGQYDGDPPTITSPSPPSELVPSLQDMIEATDDESAIGLISDLIAQVQILAVRIGSLNEEIRAGNVAIPLNVESYIIQAGTIYAEAAAMFQFARRQSDTVSATVSWDDVRSGLNVMGARQHRFPRLHETLTRYHNTKISPLIDRD